jgi:small subunit ribosomal protein S21
MRRIIGADQGFVKKLHRRKDLSSAIDAAPGVPYYCQSARWAHLSAKGVMAMPVIHIKEDESFENALRRFKRKCEKSGILSELKKRQHYEKPSAKRKRKAIAARKKMLRKLSEERRAGV